MREFDRVEALADVAIKQLRLVSDEISEASRLCRAKIDGPPMGEQRRDWNKKVRDAVKALDGAALFLASLSGHAAAESVIQGGRAAAESVIQGRRRDDRAE